MIKEVYLAGPITGLDYEASTNWRNLIAPKFSDHIKTLSPMRDKEYLKNKGILKSNGLQVNVERAILFRDYNDVVKRANCLLVNFLGAKDISIGTQWECAWSFTHQIPLVLVMEEKDNPNDYPFLTQSAGWRVDNLDDAVTIINGILG